jgi:hypothetical protein
MPAVQEILSTINQFALARLPMVGVWRTSGFEASRTSLSGRPIAPARADWADLPESEYAHAGAEPLLEEVLGDPVVQLIMQADRVQPADLRRLLGVAPRHHVTPIDPGAICPH